MSVSDLAVVYYINERQLIMTEDDRKLLLDAYKKTFNYDPNENEVDAKYDEEFQKWEYDFIKK